MFVGGLSIGTTFLFFPDWIVASLYPGEFDGSIPVLRIMGAVVVLLFVNEVLGSALNATNDEALRFRVAAAATLIDVLACLLLIPRFAHLGATVATLLTHVTVAVGYVVCLRRRSALRLEYAFFLRAALALLGSGVGSLLLARIHPLVGIIAAPMIFAGSCVGLGVFREGDRQLARDLLREWKTVGRARKESSAEVL
jgi:O-antigen/teichoic acid export membrane protein